ncbi:uncharacterized protein LOC106646767 isoform X1 [Copidosoma floridanum]|uniref:uncharacterized protein LOC106646767 isoform X1 n=1 Tax=Copidosoma floridanum TaxID=29053 RepID=UPI000C6F56CC|nr:uncharacterized protein LOC106646767 isoform X1 [Copidosoma floridanum]
MSTKVRHTHSMEKNERGMYQELCSDQMDITGRYNTPVRCDARIEETELGELGGNPGAVPANHQHRVNLACHDGACKSRAQRHQPVHRLESPWHHLKTVFLVSIIISFIVWIVAYVLLVQYGVV